MIESRASKSFARNADCVRSAEDRGSAGDSSAAFGDLPGVSQHRCRRADVFGESPKTAGESPALPDRISPCVWLNLVCLDAPIVAVSWLFLFARSFAIPIAPGGTSALFLTAWLIYLADRFGDSLSLDAHGAMSLRQRFCLRHRTIWLLGLLGIAAADMFVISTRLEKQTLILGGGLGAFALAYLIMNQARSTLWRSLPLKEIAIGFLFAAGTLVSLGNRVTSALFVSWMLFACLCSLNCISIAIWESRLDRAQGRVSIATAFPNIAHAFLTVLLLLGLTSLGLARSHFGVPSVFLCIVTSACFLATLHIFRSGIAADTRTALADLVLLTPIVALLL